MSANTDPQSICPQSQNLFSFQLSHDFVGKLWISSWLQLSFILGVIQKKVTLPPMRGGGGYGYTATVLVVRYQALLTTTALYRISPPVHPRHERADFFAVALTEEPHSYSPGRPRANAGRPRSIHKRSAGRQLALDEHPGECTGLQIVDPRFLLIKVWPRTQRTHNPYRAKALYRCACQNSLGSVLI